MVQPSMHTQAAIAAYNKDAPSQALVIIKNAEVPRPGPGEVLVHINLRPINPSDIFWCTQTACLGNVGDYDITHIDFSDLVPSPAQPARHIWRLQAFQTPRGARAGRWGPLPRTAASQALFWTITGLVLLPLPPLAVLAREKAAWFRAVAKLLAPGLSRGHHVQALAWLSSWGRV